VVQEAVELPSGDMMPTLGLGTWRLQGSEGLRAIRAALEMGYRHIDTAEMYENQETVGEAVRDRDREALFITSKVTPQHLRHGDVIATCEAALLEMGIDYIDLYLIHWPNPDVPMEQTFDALARLVELGRIRNAGVSNFQSERLSRALGISSVPIANNQVELHPFLYQRDLIRLCHDNGVSVTAYCPLARGKVFRHPTLRRIGEEHGRTPGQVALRWLLQKGCIVIPRSLKERHLRENMQVYDWSLSEPDVAAIDDIPERLRLINPEFEEFGE